MCGPSQSGSLFRNTIYAAMKSDIQNREDIDSLMKAFYSRAIGDEVIGYIFTDVAKIILEAPGTETDEYQVCDLLGQVIDRGSVYSDNGFHSLRLPTRHWKPGTYLFVASDGKRLVHQRLIKVNER